MSKISYLLLLTVLISISSCFQTNSKQSFYSKIINNDSLMSNLKASEKLPLSSFLLHISNPFSVNKLSTSLKCEGCKIFVSLIKSLPISTLASLIQELAILICETKLRKEVCSGAVNEMASIVITSLENHYLSSDFLCGELLDLCAASYKKLDAMDYVKDVLKDKIKREYPTPTQRKTYKIIHLSDPHADAEYLEGSNAKCDEPLCCVYHNGPAPSKSTEAGFWGTDADCDLPLRTLEGFADFIRRKFNDIDFIIWTGDNMSHDVWHQNKTRNLNSSILITDILLKYLPNMTIFPIIGNHEPFPVNVYNFKNDQDKWLINGLASAWRNWLGEEGYETFKSNGFYSRYIKEKNLRIIGIHTQACNNQNWHFFDDPTDPGNMLEWLRKELQSVEELNQTAFILGHIASGMGSCLPEWSIRYKALIDRYDYYIRGQFFGHSHSEDFFLSKSFIDNSTVGLTLISGSLTTYSYLFPEFRIFEVDSDTNLPVNYQQYRLNLTKYNLIGNKTNEIDFDLVYNFREEYNQPDMSFKSFENLQNSFKSNITILQKFLFNKGQGSPTSKKNSDAAKLETEGINEYCSKFGYILENEECFGTREDGPGLEDKVIRFLTGKWRKNIN